MPAKMQERGTTIDSCSLEIWEQKLKILLYAWEKVYTYGDAESMCTDGIVLNRYRQEILHAKSHLETHSNNYWYYYYSYVDNSSGAVYARTIPDLSKKELKMTGLPEILKGKSYFQPRDYLRSLRKAPILEQLVKAKLKTLSYEVLENPLKISSFQDHGALHSRLGINKDALKRLRKNDGNMKF